MTQARLTAEFQPCTSDGRPGCDTVTHSGPSTTLDLTGYVLGLDAAGVRALHEEASRFSGKDLDHIADAIPGFVEANTGSGGYDIILDGDDVEDFFRLNGIDVADLSDFDLAQLRDEYGTEKGALPAVADAAASTPGMR